MIVIIVRYPADLEAAMLTFLSQKGKK